MTYNGYANEDSFLFDVVWSNDAHLYSAIRAYGETLLRSVPGMTDQTLGLNVLHAIKAAVHIGGWGYSTTPKTMVLVPAKSLSDLATVKLKNVNETEFGAAIRDALGRDPL